MGLTSRVLAQCRRPNGWPGRLLARAMNLGHAPLTNWVLSCLNTRDVHRVLDVGCGGGGAMKKLARLLLDAELHGVDYSADAVRIAARTNRDLIAEGRAFVGNGSVYDLPYEDSRFDLVLAIESHYFWPDLPRSLAEIRRVLVSGGILVLGGGVYFGGRHDARNRRFAAAGGMNCQTIGELEGLLGAAGYSGVTGHENWRKGWFCVEGSKPSGEGGAGQ